MGEIKEVKVPDIGDFEGVDVIEVLVAPGDQVAAEDSLITLESDKATMDVPAPFAGTVREIQTEVGAKVSEGDVIVLLEVAEADKASEPEGKKEKEKPEAEEKPEPESGEQPTEDTAEKEGRSAPPPRPAPEATEKEPPPRGESQTDEPADEPADEQAFRSAYASPAVRRLARKLGVDLGKVEGTGRKGRISKEDVRLHIKERMEASERPAGGFTLPEMPAVDFSKFGATERVEMSRIRKVGAKNLHRSWLHVPHVTQHDEADVTDLEAFRKAQKGEAEKRGVKLTLLAFVMKACVRALQEYPAFNASLDPDGEHLILKKYYHLGIAVDTADGLVVPVVRDVDRKGLFELAGELGAVSSRARGGKLAMSDFQGASFTISSLGGLGGTAFTPIVNAPEVAILGVSRIQQRPVYRDDAWVPRLQLPLSLSYDHRVIDGAAGARFTAYLAGLLSDLRRLLL
jgi:pyruvate dehydrogenase E2 component (dihydrolipoamide acetyltransferase)